MLSSFKALFTTVVTAAEPAATAASFKSSLAAAAVNAEPAATATVEAVVAEPAAN